MDWIKIFLCTFLAVSSGDSLKIANSKNASLKKDDDLESKVSNFTKNIDEVLEASPSEVKQVQELSGFQKEDKDAIARMDYGEKIAESNNVKESKNNNDLLSEATRYSGLVTLRESRGPVYGNNWPIPPGGSLYRDSKEFKIPIPVIESKSFVNKPKMSTTQVNYPRQQIVEGRQADSRYQDSREVNDNRNYPEQDHHPGRGHSVLTETTHDYGRFLPEDYKSKIEKEAETLVKKKKTQNGSDTDRDRKNSYREKPNQSVQVNVHRAPGYYSQNDQPKSFSPDYSQNDQPKSYSPDFSQNDKPNSFSPGYSQNDQPKPYSPDYSQNDQPKSYSPGYSQNDQSKSFSPGYSQNGQPKPYSPDYSQNDQPKSYSPGYSQKDQPKSLSPGYYPQTDQPKSISPGYYAQNDQSKSLPPGYYSQNDKPKSFSKSPVKMPVNTAFFRKGGFETAYEFPEDDHSQNDHRLSHTTEKYPKQQYTSRQREPVNSSPVGNSYIPRQPVTSTETYQPEYPYQSERYSSSTPGSLQNSPRQYDTSTEKYSPTYSNTFQKPKSTYSEAIPYAPKHYDSVTGQPPPYHHEEKKHLSPPPENFKQAPYNSEPPQKEYHSPYSSNPAVDAPPSSAESPHYKKKSAVNIPLSTEPLNSKIGYDGPDEKAYFNTFKSLMDLYKSFGFQPYSFGEMPELIPPHFGLGNPFGEKLTLSTPMSGSLSTEDFHLNPDGLKYSGNINANPHTNQNYKYRPPYADTSYNSNPHVDAQKYSVEVNSNPPTNQNHDNYRSPYTDTSYNSSPSPHGYSNKANNEDGSYIIHTTHEPDEVTHYNEQAPFDSNRSPVASTEHYGPPENPPPAFNAQVEAPKQSYTVDKYNPDSTFTKHTPPGDVEVKGIRIKDYDAETYYGNPPQNSGYNTGDISSSASLPDTAPPEHSVVRQNPYDVQTYHSGEQITTNRPRVYRQKIHIQDLNPSITSEERSNNFRPNVENSNFNPENARDNFRDSGGEASRDPYAASNENNQHEYNLPASKKSIRPQPESKSWKPPSHRIYRDPEDSVKDEFTSDNPDERRRRRKKGQNVRKTYHSDLSHRQPEERSRARYADSESTRPSKRNSKRSSHRSPSRRRSNRSHRDHMRAEGSTHHWGMEKHKDTDGNFQYANVPGAKAFEFGYRMGGPEHTRERHHKTKGNISKIKVNWEDSNGDSGDHYWEFNHDSREDDTEERTPKRKSNHRSKKGERIPKLETENLDEDESTEIENLSAESAETENIAAESGETKNLAAESAETENTETENSETENSETVNTETD